MILLSLSPRVYLPALSSLSTLGGLELAAAALTEMACDSFHTSAGGETYGASHPRDPPLWMSSHLFINLILFSFLPGSLLHPL